MPAVSSRAFFGQKEVHPRRSPLHLSRLTAQEVRDLIGANDDNSLGLVVQTLRLIESGGLGRGSIAFELRRSPVG